MKKLFALLMLPVFIAGPAAAETYKGRTELGLQLGGVIWEGDNNLVIDEDFVYGGRLGHYLTDNVEVELGLLAADAGVQGQSRHLDVLIPTLEGSYHFGEGALRPFLAAGVGMIDFDFSPFGSNDRDDFAVTYGGGLKWLATQNLAARIDVRHLINTEIHQPTHNALVTAGLSWLFGEGEVREKASKAVAKVVDSDNDGVADDMDKCPNTPAGEKVGADGCPIPAQPIDTDGDGVTDDKDECPDTAQGVRVDSKGCPRDTDNDGVPNGRDNCPGTPEGTEVDSNGCPKEAAIPATDTWVLKGVQFETSSDKLKPESRAELDKAVEILKKNPTVTVEVQGHTDNVGADKANQTLSERRAASVKAYLVNAGIDAARLQAKGYGESQPAADNATAEGRAQNRRIEFKVLSR